MTHDPPDTLKKYTFDFFGRLAVTALKSEYVPTSYLMLIDIPLTDIRRR